MKKLFATLLFSMFFFVACNDSDKEGDTNGDFVLEQETPYYSFSTDKVTMSASAKVTLNLTNSKGAALRVLTETRIPVEIDETLTTAVEGTHFSFSGEKEIVIAPNKSSGEITLNWILTEEDHDVVALKAVPEEDFILGNFDIITIKILGAQLYAFEGEWVFKSELTPWGSDHWTMWYMEFTKGEWEVPAETDKITITDGEKFETSLSSFLKNYFGASCEMTFLDEHTMTNQDWNNITVRYIELNNINRYWSSTETSEDDVAILGARVLPADGATPALLELYLIDHEIKGFMPELFGGSGYAYPNAPEKPTTDTPAGVQSGSWIGYVFQKVAE